MVILVAIPSYITVQGKTTLATYRGQARTCQYCGANLHFGMNCVTASKVKVQKASVNRRLRAVATPIRMRFYRTACQIFMWDLTDNFGRQNPI